MPFLSAHHAKVLVESKFAHGIESVPVHHIADKYSALRGGCLGYTLEQNGDLSFDPRSVGVNG